ncbi:hypothetical protein [Proteus terrae]|uniref:hypothetical protein n=1 Tax=Proteus terrae TaxID=1574161 RepID=UPI00298C16A1|nr:hypothetical protein [Proteus terrae]WPD00638.1 hypothetical protein R5P25_09055 [Proteus terrae]
MADKTGGSAFPARWHQDMQFVAKEGMSLRDYLAAKAMQPMIAYFGEQAFSDYSMNEISEEAYRMADAMLKAKGGDMWEK